MVEPAPDVSTTQSRSRRAILAGALGGLAGLLGIRASRPAAAAAASGDPLVLGSVANDAGTGTTSMTTSSTGTALLVTQNGTGTALRGSAVGTGSIAGFFTAQNGTGISGVTANPANYGVFGENNGAAGTAGAVRANGHSNHGLVASTASGSKAAIEAHNMGVATGNGAAIRAFGGNNPGLDATSANSPAIRGTSPGSGVDGFGAIGVAGEATNGSGIGVSGYSYSGHGVEGGTAEGYAGWFSGPVFVSGLLTKSGGGFKIDHPLDPAKRYLTHSFVESPDMKNVYDGRATLDARGETTVELPGYFEALNRDLRYQLTPLGGAAPELHVKSEVAKGRFRIAGGQPGQEVCWQVTGTRQDAFAEAHRIVVDEAKPAAARGLYLHPQLHGQPAEKGIGLQHRLRDLPRAQAG